MDYLQPRELAAKMVAAGEEKLLMSTRDTIIRGIGAGALLTLAAFFALTVKATQAASSLEPYSSPLDSSC